MVLSSAASTAICALETLKNHSVYSNCRVQSHVNLLPTLLATLLATMARHFLSQEPMRRRKC